MIKIKLYDKKGNIEVKLSKGKKFIISKERFANLEKFEVSEVCERTEK